MSSQSTITRLQNINCSNVPLMSYSGIEEYARVASVTDGDTIVIVLYINKALTKLKVRFDGIDAPELRSKEKKESEAGVKSMNALKELINDKIVKVHLKHFDKYGRTLCDVYTLEPIIDDITSVKDWLLRMQYARDYDGGYRCNWNDEQLNAVGKDRSKTTAIIIT